jgi:hypothetical protein
MDGNEVQEERMVEATPVERFDEGVVEKPFSSEYRRHRAGDAICRGDLRGSRLDFDHLGMRGFIKPSAKE